jgi:SHS2 domain-containing protein
MARKIVPVTRGRMTMSACPVPEHEFGEHRGEERLIVRAATLGDALVEAAQALAELQGVHGPVADQSPWRTIEVTATDRAGLLIEWLNELIFLAESEHWVPMNFMVEAALPTRFRARAQGVVLPVAPSRIKAATWHGLRFDSHNGMLEAEVVLDV